MLKKEFHAAIRLHRMTYQVFSMQRFLIATVSPFAIQVVNNSRALFSLPREIAKVSRG